MRVSFNWLKDFVHIKSEFEHIKDVLTMTGLEINSVVTIDDDHVMEIEVTPNRPDCLSMLGVARELSAGMAKPLILPESVKKNIMKKGPRRGSVKVEVLDKKACPRYTGCIIKNVKVGNSPEWLVKRLNAMGVRSVNNIVDITNYVLFELGQPIHAFDLDKLSGKKIIVRRAKKGEGIITIDGVKRTLEPHVLIIADAEKPVAIAGIMGGKDTEISDTTKNVLLESAYFDPVIIRKTQMQIGLASESSYRFERGVDIRMVLAASIRAQELIREIAGGRVAGRMIDTCGKLEKERIISISLDEIPRILGVEIDADEVMDIFKRLNLSPVKKKDKIYVRVPSYRTDLDASIDLIEEIARLHGYSKIPVKLPAFIPYKKYQLEKETMPVEKEIRHILCSLGLHEVITYALTSRASIEALGFNIEEIVRLKNPLSSQQEYMRPSLISEMLEVINWNLNRKNISIQFFELNKIYRINRDRGGEEERMHLCIGMAGTTQGNWKEKARSLDFFDVKGVIEELLALLGIKDYKIERLTTPFLKDTLSARLIINGKLGGILGEVRQDVARMFDIKREVYVSELFIEELMPYMHLKKTFLGLPKYPSIKRDIALLVDDGILSSAIHALIKEESHGLAKSIDVFDLYKGQQVPPGKKSIAYTIEYRSDEKTLKDEEANEVHKRVQEALVKKLRAEIR